MAVFKHLLCTGSSLIKPGALTTLYLGSFNLAIFHGTTPLNVKWQILIVHSRTHQPRRIRGTHTSILDMLVGNHRRPWFHFDGLFWIIRCRTLIVHSRLNNSPCAEFLSADRRRHDACGVARIPYLSNQLRRLIPQGATPNPISRALHNRNRRLNKPGDGQASE